MSIEKVIAMAQEAGAFCRGRSGLLLREQYFEHFAELVRSDYSNKHSEFWLKQIDKAVKAEREACAKVCDELDKQRWKEYSEHHTDYGDNIRARNNT
jgi:hypothetical protein